MKTPSFKDVLPEYPSMIHLPWKPNNKGDKVAGWDVADLILGKINVTTWEKIDGANCGMAYLDGHPVVRSRSKILRKGQELKNPSQKQFASAWNWMHDNRHKFEWLAEKVGPVSVYGEWMLQQHGMEYDALPDWFVTCGGDKPQPVRGDRSVLRPVEACPVVQPPIRTNYFSNTI
jgi:hypothetical protein